MILEKNSKQYNAIATENLRKFFVIAKKDGYLNSSIDATFAAGFVSHIFQLIIFDRLHIEGFDKNETVRNFVQIIFGGIISKGFADDSADTQKQTKE